MSVKPESEDAALAAGGRGSRSIIRMGFGLEILGHWALRAPRLTLALVACLVIGAGFSASRIGFDDSLYSIYSNDTADFEHFNVLSELFPVLRDREVILFEGPDTTTRAGLELIRSIHLEVQFVDGVLGATSLFSTRQKSVGGAVPEPVFPREIPDGAELDAVLDQVAASPLAGERILAPDRSATLMTVAIDPDSDAIETSLNIREVAQSTFDELSDGLDMEIGFTGAPLLRSDILTSLRQDQRRLNGIGFAVTLLLCMAFFGRLRLVALALLPGATGIVWILGTLAAVGQDINAINSVLPTLVLVIAFSDSLHMTNSMRTALSEGLSAREAAERCVTRVGPACAMTSITTAIAFCSLATSSSEAIGRFGVAGAVATTLAYLAVITIIPCLGALILRPSDGPTRGVIDGWLSRLTSQIAGAAGNVVSRHARAVVVTGTVMLAITSVFYFSVEPRYGYRDFLPDQSRANEVIDRIDTLFSGADNATILIHRTVPAGGASPSPAEVVREVHQIADGVEPFGNIISLKTAEDWIGRDLSAWAGTAVSRDDPDLLRLNLGMPEHVAAQFKSDDASAWLVSTSLASMDASLSVPLFDALDRSLDPVREKSPGYDISVTGIVPMTTRAGLDLVASLNINLAAAVIVTIAMVALSLRSALLGLLAGVPNLLPLSIAGTVLYLTGTGLQITGMVALTVAFGIAVDDTIHLVHRWQLERGRFSPAEAIDRAVRRVGPILIATTIVLSAGLVATLSSGLPMVRLFGSLCILTFVAAAAATLYFMPAAVSVFASRLSPPRQE